MVGIEGVPVKGLVDTGSDITIIGGQLFKRVVITARLQTSLLTNHLAPTTTSRSTSMDVWISRSHLEKRTWLALYMYAPDPLLLSEGVGRQLGIVQYHQMVQPQSTVQRKPSCVTQVSTQKTPSGVDEGQRHNDVSHEPRRPSPAMNPSCRQLSRRIL